MHISSHSAYMNKIPPLSIILQFTVRLHQTTLTKTDNRTDYFKPGHVPSPNNLWSLWKSRIPVKPQNF